MLVLVPLVIVAISGGVRNEPFFPRSLGWVPLVAGGLFLIVGLRLMARTIRLFASSGKGTLAPWDPPGQLVVAGPYRHVRNPMISGVLSVLLAESLLLESSGVAIWFAVFFLVAAIIIPLFEEPGLVRRFGDEYRAYRAAVPRWIPSREPFFGPWEAREGGGGDEPTTPTGRLAP